MNNRLKAALIASALALAATVALARPLQYVDEFGNSTSDIPTVTFDAGDLPTLDTEASQRVNGFVPQWSLGPIGFDTDGGNLEIASVVGAPEGITVDLADATNGGGAADRLTFEVTAAPGVQPGEYPVTVTVRNTKFGEEGIVTVMVMVQ